MKVDVYMPLYIGDYLKDTMHLTPEQHGIYDLLLMNYWIRGEALPDDDEYLARVTKSSLTAWHSHRPVIGKFFAIGQGRWTHERTEQELDKARKQKEAKSKGGKIGALARWNSKPKGEPMAMPLTDPMANSKQDDARQRQRQHYIDIDIDNRADGKGGYSVRALQIAHHIIGNSSGWHYDNCKVQIGELSSRSLASVIEPFLKRIADNQKFLRAWQEAARIAHGAAVDGLARNPTAYAIQCFKEQITKSL
ncbi:MAG TPA: DUF1376 domain-containing protein [Verrucomicrobiae bacterium]|nr:DUF1376 domain-containing protein [Verrucomicrobiae bacterium]